VTGFSKSGHSCHRYIDIRHSFSYIADYLAHEGRFSRRSLKWSKVRCLRAGVVTPLPGGSGTPLDRHYDRSARSSLNWDRPIAGNTRVSRVLRKRGLGLSCGIKPAANVAVERRKASALRSARSRIRLDAAGRKTRLSALRFPSFARGIFSWRDVSWRNGGSGA
jgi:hypothetical protein